jgi:hypothetical protein
MKHNDAYYARMADSIEHDHEIGSKYADMYQSEGAVGRASNRFRPQEQRVPVRNTTGQIVWCTPTQLVVLRAGRSLEGQKASATIIAASIGVAVSTVTRALTFLAAFKLIAYDVTMGRNGGITFLAMAWADLKMRCRNAWARIQQQKARAYERYLHKLEGTGYYSSGLNFATSNVIDAKFSDPAS